MKDEIIVTIVGTICLFGLLSIYFANLGRTIIYEPKKYDFIIFNISSIPEKAVIEEVEFCFWTNNSIPADGKSHRIELKLECIELETDYNITRCYNGECNQEECWVICE